MTGKRFFEKGWLRFPHDPVLAEWIACALPAARAAAVAPENAKWLRCGGTWFAGVNALPNDASGAVPGGPALAGAALDFIHDRLNLPDVALDRGQVSICYPGYPNPTPGESKAAFHFRRDRDAAHLDGLLPEGPQRRRYLRERHGFVLGISMVPADAEASPLVVWEGSHRIVRETFMTLFQGVDPAHWGEIDVTDTYHAARRRVFESCARVAVAARPGEAVLVHRLAIHGVAPWAETAKAGPDGRMIVYFRPETGTISDWLFAP